MGGAADEPDTPVLVDTRVLAALQRVVGAPQVQGLVREGIEAYGHYCDALEPQAGQAAEPARALASAHKLKGSSGTLGLRAISTLAARVEAALETGADAARDIGELRRAIAATRQELARLGIDAR